MPTTSFCDLPDATRMGFVMAIDHAGGVVEGYNGDHVQVALPNPATPFIEAMESAGLELVKPSLHLFPLGSDAPPVSLRHPCSKYGPGLAFWMFANFVPKS